MYREKEGLAICPSSKNLNRILPKIASNSSTIWDCKIFQEISRKAVPEPTAYSALSFSQWWKQKTTLLKCQNGF